MTTVSRSATTHILRASALIGSSSAIAVLSGIAKAKVLAVLVGPAGIGLLGLLQSIQSTTATASGMGLSNSGVRQIAEAKADENSERLACTKASLLGSGAALGLAGAGLLFLLREPIAQLIFHDNGSSGLVAWLALGVWATTLSGAQTALLNGLHRLRDVATVNVCGPVCALLATSVAAWLWKDGAVVVAVVSLPLASLLTSWWLIRRIPRDALVSSLRAMLAPLRGLLTLGFVFMATALMSVGSQFAVRVLVTRTLGVVATGHFQAAWTVSVTYVGFILGSMAVDYYPRLTGVARDPVATNTMANEQAEVTLLLAGPVILLMLAATPAVVTLLYSSAFGETVGILRWQVLGDLFKVASWPLGFILLAQGRSGVYFATEVTWNLVYISLVWFGLERWGLEATGMAFLVAYAFLFLLISLVVYRLHQFSWSKRNLTLFIALLACVAGVALARSLSGPAAIAVPLLLTFAVACYSVHALSRLLGGPWWPQMTGRW